MHFGYTGLLNFGQVGFALVGAYGVGIAVATLRLVAVGWPSLFGLLAGVVLALVLGVPTLRLRGDYFAITTIAAAEVLRLVVRSSWAEPVTGGPFGLQRIAGASTTSTRSPPGQLRRRAWYLHRPADCGRWLVTWAVVLAGTLLVVRLLMRSPWGRVLKAIREDEDAARALGKNVFAYKMQGWSSAA